MTDTTQVLVLHYLPIYVIQDFLLTEISLASRVLVINMNYFCIYKKSGPHRNIDLLECNTMQGGTNNLEEQAACILMLKYW